MTVILPCNRIGTTVNVHDPQSGISASCNPIVDTGAVESCLSLQQLSPALGNSSVAFPLVFSLAGLQFITFLYSGPIAEIQAEPPGGGSPTSRQTPDVRVHYLSLPLPPPFTTFDGIMAMNMLDSLSVDPAKDVSATRAYLAERV
jgi:hypothetical protein